MKALIRAMWGALLAGTIGLLVAAGTRAEDAAEKEYARFRGTWRFTSIEMGGESMPVKQFEKTRLILEGRRFTVDEGDTTLRGTFKVDVSTTPKRIDVTFTNGPEAGKTALGIYQLDGDTYRVCIGLVGKDRPTAFVSKPGSGHVLEVLKREKGGPKEKKDPGGN